MNRPLLFASLGVTILYVAVTSLWWYQTGREAVPREVENAAVQKRLGGSTRYRRGLPIVALQRYPDLRIELDGRPAPVTGPDAEGRRAFSEMLRHKPRPKVDPVVLAGGGASSVDITRVEPGDGPRPGAWVREDHWVRAAWTDPKTSMSHERVWSASEIMRAFEREVGPGQEPEAVFLELGSPVLTARPLLFGVVVVWLLCAWCALASGLCEGRSPRALFGRTLAAGLLGPIWLILVWLRGPGNALLIRKRRSDA